MKTVKIITFLIIMLFITLAFTFSKISKENSTQDILLNVINEQKAYTQTISKDIFYIYKNKTSDTKNLDETIDKFLLNLKNKSTILKHVHSQKINLQSELIIKLWEDFFKSVQEFKKLHSVASIYSDIILNNIVKDIYNKNINLVTEFNKLINIQKIHYDLELKKYKYTQYIILILLIFFLYYLFVQIKDNLTFMHKFLNSSNNIINNASIKNLKPISIQTSNTQTMQATSNFNVLVDTINTAINNSSESIKHSQNSLIILEENIEQLFDLISTMQSEKILDKQLSKKEDAVIEALEEITSSSQKLHNLKYALDNLITHTNKDKA